MRNCQQIETQWAQPVCELVTLPFYNFLTDFYLLFVLVFIEFAKKQITEKIDNVAEQLKDGFEVDRQFEEIAQKLLTLFKADRVVLSQLVNGETTPVGYHFYKLKIVKEATTNNLINVSDILGSDVIPILNLREEFDTLLENKEMLVTSRDLRKLPPKCRKHLQKIQVKSLYQVLIIYDEEPLGLITVHYKTNKFSDFMIEAKKTQEFYKLRNYYTALLSKRKKGKPFFPFVN